FFFFHDTAPTYIYTLSLHDALPICYATDLPLEPESLAKRAFTLARYRHPLRVFRDSSWSSCYRLTIWFGVGRRRDEHGPDLPTRSEEHTSELQSLTNLVCRLLLEKK